MARGGGYSEHKPQLREIVDTAATLAGGDDAALQGTSLHEFTELVDQGQLDWTFVPEELRGPIEAYQEATERLKFVDSEVFVTTETDVDGQPFRLAGSLDRLYELDGQILVGDLKTGANEPSYPLGVTTQVAIYAHGRRYRDDLFPGSPPFKGGEPNADSTSWRADLHEHVSQTTGLMIHLPINRVRNKWVCKLYALDLDAGWAAARLGFTAQGMRRMPKLEEM